MVNAFDIPARQAFLIDMVGREDLMNAIALNSSMFNGARILGPAVAGILVAWVGEGWCFFVNAVSYIAVIVGLLLMRIVHPAKLSHEGSPLENILEGFRFVRDAKPIRVILLLLGLVSLVGMPYSVLMPVFAHQILHGGARELGILMGATGVGALLGALSLATRVGVKGLGRLIAICAGGFRCEPDPVFVLTRFLAVGDLAGAGGFHDDGADGIVEHAGAVDVARSIARACDCCLFDDVHGHGSVWGVLCGSDRAPYRRAVDGGYWRSGVYRGSDCVRHAPAEHPRPSA